MSAGLQARHETQQLIQTSAFESVTRAMAISNDSVFRSADNRIEVCNLAGKCRLHYVLVLLRYCVVLATPTVALEPDRQALLFQ